jgi:glycosyltransferase involved in cell wall biosynthesis
MAEKSAKLSICIPTWNRSKFLQKTLSILAGQIETDRLGNQVEICISDNGSTDDTPSVIGRIVDENPNLRFALNRFPENQGFSVNMDAAVRLASGEFVFLLGDDDIFAPRGMVDLLEACSGLEADTLVILNLKNADCNSEWSRTASSQQVVFRDVRESLMQLGKFHPTFIGNFVFRRTAYLQHFHPRFLQSIYPHTGILFEIMRGKQVHFRNLCCLEVDDSDRHVGDCQARATAVDMARIQTEGHLRHQGGQIENLLFYRVNLRSIPRAMLLQRSGLCKERRGIYSELRIRNLMNCYNGSTIAMVCSVIIISASRLVPKWLLRVILR